MNLEFRVKKLKPYATLPNYANPGDAGMDLYSAEDYVIDSGKRQLVSTGISAEFPTGYVALFWDKSGLAAKKGITVLAGVIDSGYRGEYGVVLFNTSKEQFEIKRGDKIAQCLIQPITQPDIKEVQELSDTQRGTGGFGSTGK